MNAYSEKISYVIVDTQNHVLARCALDHSQSQFPLEKALVFSDDQAKWGDTSIIEIPKITDLQDYNRFILCDLYKYIDTEFCLIIQYDGFVIDGSMFARLFLEYDYIGAVWPHYEHFTVGCGGMSLRSKRLLQATAGLLNTFSDFDIPEDLVICRYYRTFLEQQYGIRFAPPAIANHFSEEMLIQPWSTFSFHGPAMLPVLYKNELDFLFENLGPQGHIKMLALEKSCEKIGPHALRALRKLQDRYPAL
jgi:hypothetical protein